jgi:hypothetical protein
LEPASLIAEQARELPASIGSEESQMLVVPIWFEGTLERKDVNLIGGSD